MKRCIIFLNSDHLHPLSIRLNTQTDDLILCVDGGVRHAQAFGITPHIILGDFDSLPPKTKEFYITAPVEWISHPPGKDQYETDSELAIRVAKERGATECVIYGFSGNRFDHMAANLFLFARYAKCLRITIIEPDQRLTYVVTKHEWKGEQGDIVSLVALSGAVRGLTTENLRFPLSGFTLKQGATVGISNVMTASHASVRIRSGVLLVIHAHHV